MEMSPGYELPLACDTACGGSCCRGDRYIAATQAQMDFMEASGNNFEVVIPPVEDTNWADPANLPELMTRSSSDFDSRTVQNIAQELQAGEGMFHATEPCKQLDADGKCTVYNDPNRPAGCERLAIGGHFCLEIRRGYGVEGKPQPQKVDLANVADLLQMLRKRAS
ncbi:MAG TPA: hypothetical protein VLG11_03105 [Candidatus Saccharimonadales bacterium]|nr:hypothetical protein [Candidatus Saccharimonadales bacterium]